MKAFSKLSETGLFDMLLRYYDALHIISKKAEAKMKTVAPKLCLHQETLRNLIQGKAEMNAVPNTANTCYWCIPDTTTPAVR